MTPLTIVYAVEQWHQHHGGRWPKARDLCGAEHLPHWTTICKSGFSSLSALMYAVRSLHDYDSHSLTWLWQLEHQQCVRCGKETREIKIFCAQCAEIYGGNPVHVPAPAVPPGLQARSTLYRRIAFAADMRRNDE